MDTYEKKYKEALERAKEQLEGAKVFDYKEGQIAHDIRTTTYAIFPELTVSEDEKIRKFLIKWIQDNYYHGTTEIPTKTLIAWLEKQGKEDSSIQQAYEWGYTEGKRIERKHWVEKQKFSEDYNSIDPQFGKLIEQNPAEWSEEDENTIKVLMNIIRKSEIIDSIIYTDSLKEKLYDFLNPLKERYTWKPSDEQMGVIEAVINNRSFQRRHLDSLYEQLKKLKGEKI